MGKEKGKRNPADVFRKKQKQKEKLKNKETRRNTREIGLDKKDVGVIKQQIEQIDRLESQGVTDKRQKKTKKKLLDQLDQKVTRIREKAEQSIGLGKIPTREEYEEAMTVAANKTVDEMELQNAIMYPNPENSIYYHPTLNPFGAPPPGAPMIYRDSLKDSNLLKGADMLYITGIPTSPSHPGSPSSPTRDEPPKNAELDLDALPIPLDPPPLSAKEHDIPVPYPDGPPPSAMKLFEKPPSEPSFVPGYMRVPPPPLMGMQPPMMPRMPPGMPPPGMFPPGMPPPFMMPPPHYPPPMGMMPPNMFPPGMLPPGMPPAMPPPPKGFPRLPNPPSHFAQMPVPTMPHPQPDASFEAYPEPEDLPVVADDNYADPTVLVPAQLRKVRNDPKPTKIVQKPLVQKDEAYEEFMKDMKDLGAV